MASINVRIEEDEKQAIVDVIKTIQGQVIAVNAIAKKAGFNPNRTRFIIEDLLEEGRIVRKVAKQFNEKYVRYCYEIPKGGSK
jgi:predicted transcriptional regulator